MLVYAGFVKAILVLASMGALGVLAAGCRPDPLPREPESLGSATVSVPAEPPVIVTPLAATDASADAGAELEAPAKATFSAAPSSTPGKILCGDRQCDLAREVCCEEESAGVAQCVPKPGPNQEACAKVAGALYEKHCDEKADCPGAESCCVTWGCSGGCPPVSVCSKVPCLHGPVEQCLPGGTCSPGFHCVKHEGSRVGSCAFDRAGVACGKQRCSADAPVCCWNTKTRKGQCAASCGDEPGDDTWALRCASPDDCGGYPCADLVPAPVRFTQCLGAYDVPDRSDLIFCRTLRDCPVSNMLGKPKACMPNPAFPGRAKTCVYPSG